MILRLVFIFFFISLVTGNQRGHYGYPALGLLSANPAYSTNRIETRSYNVNILSDNDSPSLQIPRPVQYAEVNTPYTERTICFTPSMIHRLVKAALEYVTQMPSDINVVVDKIDQELNRMSDPEYIDDTAVKKPLYPLDSRTILNLLRKPSSKARTNLILKYELPTAENESHCREALEKLIEIAYSAYRELEHNPQCQDYLYNFASHQAEDRPIGHIDQGSDLKSLISTILDEIDNHKSNRHVEPEANRYGEIIDLPIKEYPEMEFPIRPILHRPVQKPVHEYNIQPLIEYPRDIENYPALEYNIPKINEYNIPDIHEFTIPKINDYADYPNHEYYPEHTHYPDIQDNPKIVHEFNIPKMVDHPVHEFNIPKIVDHPVREFNIPKIVDHSYNIPKPYVNIPDNLDYNDHPNHKYPHTPQFPQDIDIPESHDQPNIPMEPEETINVIVNILENNDNLDDVELFHRLIVILEENQISFQPRVFKLLINLLSANKHHNIPRLIDIILLLLDFQVNQWPWNNAITELILSFLIPDSSGRLDPRIVDIILNLYKQQPNEKQVENILSLLRPFKDGNMDDITSDAILELILSHLNNKLEPEYFNILLQLLEPSLKGVGDTKEVEIIIYLTKWSEIGINPNQLQLLFKLLMPYINGNTDPRLLDIIHFLLTQSEHLNVKYLDFILSFLYPTNGIIDTRRIDIIHFILHHLILYPEHMNILLTLLESENGPRVLISRFFEILLYLNSKRLLTFDILDIIIRFIQEELTGHPVDNEVQILLNLLAPYTQSNPKIMIDILSILNPNEPPGNIVRWIESPKNIILPNHGPTNPDFYPKPDKGRLIPPVVNDEYRTPDDGYQEVDNDFNSILKLLDDQGLLEGDEAADTDLINKILGVLEMGERKLGIVELTYQLKHEKPLIYQPVYYVKYRLPLLNFIKNMKSLLLKYPHLNSDPMRLLQELIAISNVTEVSPNLQGYPKEEILKLTANEGDLVQAKIVNEQNLNLNDQITVVHGLNSDILPEELLQLNEINEAKYYPNVVHIRAAQPETITVRNIKQIVQLPPVHYQKIIQTSPRLTHTIPITYIARTNEKQITHEKSSILK